jgi:3-phenylpropionate/trans-cinnamate dioxygenase ferredoxin component
MAEWVTVCPASEIPEGQREVFGINDRWIAVFNVCDKYYAIEDLCTHDGNNLAFDRNDQPSKLDNHEIECPRHGGRFDIRNGQATRSPADIDVPWYKIRVTDGNIQILI